MLLTTSQRQLLQKAIEESRKEADMSKKRRKTLSPTVKKIKSDKVQRSNRAKSSTEQNEVAVEEENPCGSNLSPTKWLTTGSHLIGEKCRRALAPQFYHLVPKSAFEGSIASSNIRLIDGVVSHWKAPHGRTPALYRILYRPATSPSTTDYYYEENLTTEELLSGIASAAKRYNASLTVEQFSKEQDKVKLYNKAMHHLLADQAFEALVQLLPQLIVAAMQELTLEKCVQTYIAEETMSTGGASMDMSSQPRYGKYLPYTQVYKQAWFRGGAGSIVDSGNRETMVTTVASPSSSPFYSSFVGSLIGQRIRQGGLVAHDLLRRSNIQDPIDYLNIFEPGGRVASCILRYLQSTTTVVDPFQLTDAIKNVATRDIQRAVIDKLLDRPVASRKGTKKKQEDEEQSQQMQKEPSLPDLSHLLICTSGDVENDFLRAKYSLTKAISKDDDDLMQLEDLTSEGERAEKESKLKGQQHFQQRMQKRLLDLQSTEGYSTGRWPKWSEVATSWMKEKESSVQSAFEKYYGHIEQVTLGAATKPSLTSSSLDLAPSTVASSSNGTIPSVQDDETLAKAIAAEHTDTANTASRRPRRTRAEGTGGGMMFYGSASGLTLAQLRDSLHRLIIQSCPSFLSFLDLKRILLSENEAMGSTSREIKKIRSSLWKLLYELGKVARCYVNNAVEYKISFDQWVGLNVLSSEGASIQGVSEQKHINSTSREELEDSTTSLNTYMKDLYQTERSLRSLILFSLQISPKSVASAADEDAEIQLAEEGANLNEEGVDNTNHPWIGKCVLRPDGTKWRVVSFTPSLLLDAVDASISSTALTAVSKEQPSSTILPPNRFVKRRCRFNLIPWVGNFNLEQSSQHGDLKGVQRLSLTEAQVNAGMDAVELSIIQKNMRAFAFGEDHYKNSSSMKKKLNTTLTLLVEGKTCATDARSTKKYISGKIVGYNGDGVAPCFLVLPQSNESDANPSKQNKGSAAAETSTDLANLAASMEFDALLASFARDPIDALSVEIDSQIVDASTAKNAFWGTVVDNGTAFEFSPGSLDVKDVSKARIVSWLDFTNPSMEACLSIMSWLKSQSKITPFLEKVDAEALGLVDYYDVIKNPMDLRTVESKLMQGQYSDANGDVSLDLMGGTNEHRPLFVSDLNLIFDNAIMYNSVDSWIHKSAAWFKKNLGRKVETERSKLEHYFAVNEKTSTFPQALDGDAKEEIDDEDEYVYMDDEDDDDSYQGASSSRRRKTSKSVNVADATAADDVIEKSFSTADILANNKTFSLFLETSTDAFSLPKDWLCRRLPSVQGSSKSNKKTSSINGNDLAQVLQQLIQTPSLQSQRRSTRAVILSTAPSKNASKVEVGKDVEYYYKSDPMVCGNNRAQVELIREALHEYFADSFREQLLTAGKAPSTSAIAEGSIEENSAGHLQSRSDNISHAPSHPKCYHKDIFPPYLGRISLATGKWEIRSHLVLPALRWVLRGMIHSGHLGCEEGTSIPSTNTPLTLSNAYFWNEYIVRPFDIVEIAKKQHSKVAESESEEEEIELSEYEKARMERVARNQERLRQLGLA